MKIVETNNLEIIKEIHSNVFSEPFSLEDYESKRKKEKLIHYIFQNEKENIGYLITYDKKEIESFHFWLGGIVAKEQGKGYFSQALLFFQQELKEKGYKEITVSSYNNRPNMLRLLIKKGYHIVGTELNSSGATKIKFKYFLRDKKEFRIIMNENIDKREIEKFFSTYQEENYTDITLHCEEVVKLDIVKLVVDNSNKMQNLPHINIKIDKKHLEENLKNILKKYSGKIQIKN